MIKKAKKLVSLIGSTLTVLLVVVLSTIYPSQSLAVSSGAGIDARPAQYQTAKAFSQTFCDVIGTGLSKESALKIASRELYKAILDKSLWSNVLIIQDKGLKSYTTTEMIALTSSSIDHYCSNEWILSTKKENINTEAFLQAKIEEYFHEI